MIPLQHALRAGQDAGSIRDTPALPVAVVIGAGGALGSAVLEQALAAGGFARVIALVNGTMAAGLRGFEARTLDSLVPAHDAAHEPAAPKPDTAFIVFDRERHANGREASFVRPEPTGLVDLARKLNEAGVKRLLVVLPHTAALLPQAFRQGLASLDEHALAALPFEQLVIVRSAQRPHRCAATISLPARLARWWFSQLNFMVPQHDQPVRAVKVAAFVARLALRLPASPPGTRVAPPELVWLASQPGDIERLIDDWLLHGELPLRPTPTARAPRQVSSL